MSKSKFNTQSLVLAALMTAFVILFQLLGTFTAFFGPFSTAVALVPIVIGAAMCGSWCGGWLGLVFGIVVLLSGGANLFLAYEIPGTIITVLLKGALCGLAAGFTYRLFVRLRLNKYLCVLIAALVCPMVNTGVFLLGCAVFFLKHAAPIAAQLGMSGSGMEIFFALAGANFIFEILMNIVLSPVMVRILNIKKK